MRDKDWKLYADGQLYHMKTDADEKKPIENDDADAKAARSKLSKLMANLKKSAIDEKNR